MRFGVGGLALAAILATTACSKTEAPAPAAPATGLLGWYPAGYLALWLATFAVLSVVAAPAGVVAYVVPCYLLSLGVLAAVARSSVSARGRTVLV